MRVKLQNTGLAGRDRHWTKRAGPDAVQKGIAADIVFMDDCRRVIGHIGNHRYIGRREGKCDGAVIQHRDCAAARLSGLRVNHPGKAPGHGIARRGGVAPPRDIARHVVRVKNIAIVPGHALANVQ